MPLFFSHVYSPLSLSLIVVVDVDDDDDIIYCKIITKGGRGERHGARIRRRPRGWFVEEQSQYPEYEQQLTGVFTRPVHEQRAKHDDID